MKELKQLELDSKSFIGMRAIMHAPGKHITNNSDTGYICNVATMVRLRCFTVLYTTMFRL